jgi:hypothetical protein
MLGRGSAVVEYLAVRSMCSSLDLRISNALRCKQPLCRGIPRTAAWATQPFNVHSLRLRLHFQDHQILPIHERIRKVTGKWKKLTLRRKHCSAVPRQKVCYYDRLLPPISQRAPRLTPPKRGANICAGTQPQLEDG